MKYEYVLLMLPPNCDGGDPVEEIALTRREHGLLKGQLAPRETVLLPGCAVSESTADYMMETPNCTYFLAVWMVDGDPIEETEITREQYIVFKARLASMRDRKRAA